MKKPGINGTGERPGGDIVQYEIGDRITLKKGHPCGANEWVIYRVGADIGLRCGGCDHRVMLPRRQVDRRIRSRMPGSEPPEASTQG